MTDSDVKDVEMCMSQQTYEVLAVGLYIEKFYKLPHGTHYNIKYVQYVKFTKV